MEKIEPNIIINNHINKNLNNRIIILKKDGSLDVLADTSGYDVDEFRHMRYFKKYFETHYLEDKNLQKFSKSMNGYAAVVYLLSEIYGNILIMDTSRGKEESKYASIQLPNKITEIQKEKFEIIRNEILNEFNEVVVFANPILIDGIPDNEIYTILENNEFDKIINYTEIDDNVNKR